MNSDILHRTIATLDARDKNWISFFAQHGSEVRDSIFSTLEDLHAIADDKYLRDTNWVLDADLAMRRRMAHIQQVDLDLRRVSKNWRLVVTQADAMQELYDESLSRLLAFCEKRDLQSNCRLYGGVKDFSSLNGKVNQISRLSKDSRVRPKMDDVWDVVRFRLVLEDAKSVRQACQFLWEDFFDAVIRCRNYYFMPKAKNSLNSYRAVHFEFANIDGHIFELQVQTRFREAISLLDHSFVFKGDIEFFDHEHELWMRAMSAAAIYLEHQRFIG